MWVGCGIIVSVLESDGESRLESLDIQDENINIVDWASFLVNVASLIFKGVLSDNCAYILVAFIKERPFVVHGKKTNINQRIFFKFKPQSMVWYIVGRVLGQVDKIGAELSWSGLVIFVVGNFESSFIFDINMPWSHIPSIAKLLVRTNKLGAFKFEFILLVHKPVRAKTIWLLFSSKVAVSILWVLKRAIAVLFIQAEILAVIRSEHSFVPKRKPE